MEGKNGQAVKNSLLFPAYQWLLCLFPQYRDLNRQDSFSKSFSAMLQMKTDFPVCYLIHGPPIITHAQEEKLLVSGFWKQINESAFVRKERAG